MFLFYFSYIRTIICIPLIFVITFTTRKTLICVSSHQCCWDGADMDKYPCWLVVVAHRQKSSVLSTLMDIYEPTRCIISCIMTFIFSCFEKSFFTWIWLIQNLLYHKFRFRLDLHNNLRTLKKCSSPSTPGQLVVASSFNFFHYLESNFNFSSWGERQIVS